MVEIMEKLEEFLKELEHNQNINIKNNLENKVDIDYVIYRIKDIIKEDTKNKKRNK